MVAVGEQLMAWTIKKLYDSGVRVSPSRKFAPSSGSRVVRAVIPYPKFNSVLFQLEHNGVTVQAQHAVNLWFSGIDIVTEQRDPRIYLVVPYQGNRYFVRKPDFYENPVRVRCSCPDFYFTFAYWDFLAGAIFGSKPRTYTRKTTNRAPRNPGHYPGFCKHVTNSVLLFQTNGWALTSHDIRR